MAARGERKELNKKAIDGLVKDAKEAGRRIDCFDAKETGMMIRVTPEGTATFAVIGRLRGQTKQTRVTLGNFYKGGKVMPSCIDVTTARHLARVARDFLRAGEKPGRGAVLPQAEESPDLFDTCMDAFLRRHVDVKNRTKDQARRLVTKELRPAWRGRKVSSITRTDVAAVLDKIVDREASTQANRVFSLVRKFFSWCVARGYLTASPCAGMEKPAAESPARDRVLDDEEVKLVWLAAEDIGGVAGALVKSLLLTGQRRNEVAGMPWNELDLEGHLWTIGVERMKAKKPHVVHLSAPMLDLIAAIPRVEGCPFVFTTDGKTHYSDASGLKRRLDAKITEARSKAGLGPIEPWRFHDLRRTMASGMAKLGVKLEAVEKILHHTSGSFGGIRGVYQRHDFKPEREAALDKWAAHVMEVVEGREPAKVVGIDGRAIAS